MPRVMNTIRLRRSSDGQRGKPRGRMKDVLDAVDDGRPVGAFQNVHDAFEAQQIGAAVLGKRLEEEGQRDRADRLWRRIA